MAIKAATKFSLNDQLFNKDSLGKLTKALGEADSQFNCLEFSRDVLARFPELGLKQRIAWIVSVLDRYLPDEFPAARDILLRALPEPLDPEKSDDDFGEFIWVVPGEYVAKHGRSAVHLDSSLDFLGQATKRFSSEAAIRPFLCDFPDQTMAFVRQWSTDSNYHVRRLACEGIRPFLPWAQRVLLPNPTILGVLDTLHADPTRYVTRSVANTLNDLSKIDPDVVIDALRRWQNLDLQDAAELGWITRHALRTLSKTDHKASLELLGYATAPADPGIGPERQHTSEARRRIRVALHLDVAGRTKAQGCFARAFPQGQRRSFGKSVHDQRRRARQRGPSRNRQTSGVQTDYDPHAVSRHTLRRAHRQRHLLRKARVRIRAVGTH